MTITLAVQIYWNYWNFSNHESNVRSELKTVLDKSLDDYFTEKTKINVLKEEHEPKMEGVSKQRFIHIENNVVLDSHKHEASTILENLEDDGNNQVNIIVTDSTKVKKYHWKGDSVNIDLDISDSLFVKRIEELTAKVYLSLNNDTINFEHLSELVSKELQERDLGAIDFSLLIPEECCEEYEEGNYVMSESLLSSSASIVLMEFSNSNFEILSRSLFGIIVSFLVFLASLLAMLLLYNQVKRQKELSEIKDDLISNMTHEFKTPIATVKAALEALEKFNASNDKEMTARYLRSSQEQMDSLLGMVDKILDSSQMDSSNLVLDKKTIDLNALLKKISIALKGISEKQISMEIEEGLVLNGDSFLLERAFTNLLENALKYGGKEISVKAFSLNRTTIIEFSDNGPGIPKRYQDKVFEKFFRVPSGELHEVKGHGIGLYTSKKIVEEHGGTIDYLREKDKSIFKLSFGK